MNLIHIIDLSSIMSSIIITLLPLNNISMIGGRTMKSLYLLLSVISAAVFISCNSDRPEPDTEQTGVIIVLNKSDDTANILDRRTGELLATVETGYQPHEVAISPDGRTAVVTNYGLRERPGNSLTIIDIAEVRRIKDIDLGEYTYPHGIQWLGETGNRLLVTAEGKDALIVVDISTGEITEAGITGQRVSHMVAATPDYRRAFVSNIGSANVTVIDLTAGEVIGHIETGAGAEGIDVSPDGKEVWVTNRSANTVSVIDTETLGVIEELVSADFPIRAKFSPNGKYVLVSNARSGDVNIFDAAERRIVATVRMDAEIAEEGEDRYFADQFEGSPIPIGIVIPPDGKSAYVANSNADVVVVIDLESFAVTARYRTGAQPDGIGWSPVRPVL
jgi:YVTN family beta-propeller protein